MILPASYANGFAPRDGSPLYPELWRGCVGAWNPGLGPTGLTLRDWGPYRNHGTLTNMDAAGDWILSEGRYSLDFDGSNDYVEAGAVGLPTGAADRTITAWVWLNAQVVSGVTAIVDLTRSSGQGFIFSVGGNSGSENGSFTDGVNFANNLFWPNGGFMEPAGVWTFRAITLQGSAYSIVSRQLNGPFRVRTSGTFAVAINTNTNGVYFGARKGFATGNQKLTDIRIYNRALSINELQTLSLRPGIAYELATRRRSSVAVAAGGFNAAWIPRRSLVIGGGTN
jgi:hypothetical protein